MPEKIKQHKRLIMNILMAILVLFAIYVKMTEEGGRVLFKQGDLYLLAGAILAFLVLDIIKKAKRH